MPSGSNTDELTNLWSAFLLSKEDDLKNQILEIMLTLQDDLGYSDKEWEDYLSTLPGFSPWWKRVRLDYLNKVASTLDDK